jgi:long-chain fatty acid transport protein
LLATGGAWPAHAAGYFSGSKGARAAGRAGAFTARADDLSAVVFNPAGLARLEGNIVQIGGRFSYNAMSFTRDPTLDWGQLQNGVPPYVEFATVHNQQPWQLLDPLLGFASNLGLRDWGFALAAYAPAGIGRIAFPVGGGQRYMMVSREAAILNYSASAAWKLRDRFGVGVSLQWIHVPRLTYSLVVDGNPFGGQVNPVASELDMLASVTGSDPFTFNAVVGAWYRPLPFLEIAVSGQVIPTQIQTNSTMSISPLVIEDEVELRRNGDPANDVSVTLPLPLTARAGVRYVHRRGGYELFDVELNLNYEHWSRVEQFTVDTRGLSANLQGQSLPVGLIAVDKRWRNTLGVHLGGDVAVVPGRLWLRGGMFYETAVASRRYANVDFPGGRQLGGALGASVLVRGVEVAIAYEYRNQPRLHVAESEAGVYQEVPGSTCVPPYDDPVRCHPQYLGQPAPAVNAGSYTAHSHIALIDALYRF